LKTKIRTVLVNKRHFTNTHFSQMMSRNRFQIIHRYLRFNDNTAIGINEDRLYNIRPILDTVVSNFKSNYIPEREISLDEGMRGWWGRLRFRIYNPGKITKYGFLVRLVCESLSGYICNMQIYIYIYIYIYDI
jgi:hypothetical protein